MPTIEFPNMFPMTTHPSIFPNNQEPFDYFRRIVDQTFPTTVGTSATYLSSKKDEPLTWTEAEGKYMIRFDLPGVKKKDASVSFDNGIISVEGKEECPVNGAKTFTYRVSLPKHGDVESISAEFGNGKAIIYVDKVEVNKTIPWQ